VEPAWGEIVFGGADFYEYFCVVQELAQ